MPSGREHRRSTRARSELSGLSARLDPLIREEEPEGGAVPFGLRGRMDGNAAVVLVDDALSCPEAQAGTGLFFGGDEWLKKALAHGFRDAVAIIRDGNDDSL